MHVPVLEPTSNVIEVDARVETCVIEGCAGTIVRHSLGGGQSVYRCARCFRRYQVRASFAPVEEPGFLRKLLRDFASWRE